MPVPPNYKPTDTRPESKSLRAEDFKLDAKWKLEIEDVSMQLMPARDGKPARNRLVVTFVGKEKSLVLNATNQSFLELRLGDMPNDWIGARIMLHRTTALMEGKQVPAFRILEASPATPPPPAAPGEDEEEATF